jgi:2-oxoisovalerate dehydrogenase E1 component
LARKTRPSASVPDLLTDEQLVHAYRVGLRVRAAITQCLLEMRKGTVRFWIGGPGEEVHGCATALAIKHFDNEDGVAEDSWGAALFPHYRSDALATMLAELRGHPNFTLDYFRQALSRATDPMSRGRQMVMHIADIERGIMPGQSPLGMNLGKAAGYAKGLKVLRKGGVTIAVCGDGSTATSDFHEACSAASLWNLPLVIIITDNEIAISVTPDEGRPIKDYAAYAQAFNGYYIACDGYDSAATYAATLEAMRHARDHQQLVLLHATVPRLRGHSSSDGAVFRYDSRDPLIEMGESLLGARIIDEKAVFRRKKDPARVAYFEDHIDGTLMAAERQRNREALEQVRAEAVPEPGDEYLWSHPEYPDVQEPEHSGETGVQINEALNLCMHRMLEEGPTCMWGQDIAGDKGGVFKVTRGLSFRYPESVVNGPINEPMILGTAIGAAHHPGLRVIPEIQFGDYSFNAMHWLVHGGNLYWSTGGKLAPNITLRTPVDPVQGGAIYHSMSVDGYFSSVQGWVICCPSTTFDAYGLLRSSGDYQGPVMFLEPKILYRHAVGPSLPGEPDGGELKQARRAGGESLVDPNTLAAVEDFRIPFGKAAERRDGRDITIVAWGNAVHQAVEAATIMAEKYQLEATVLDLRTISPWDEDAVFSSARRTGRLLVAHQDRTFAGFGRQVQGRAHEEIESLASVVVGMRNVPAVGQAKELEEHSILNPGRICDAAVELCQRPVGAFVANDEVWMQFAPTRRTT